MLIILTYPVTEAAKYSFVFLLKKSKPGGCVIGKKIAALRQLKGKYVYQT